MRLAPGDTAFQVFAYLAMHEAEPATLSQLAAAAERSNRMTWHALETLAADGFVLVEQKPSGTGWGRLYRPNVDHPIYPELRQIAFKMLGGTRSVKEIIDHNDDVVAAAIFGSVASGTDRRTGRLSDIDLLVIFAEDSTREARMSFREAVDQLSARLNRSINVEAMLRSEWDTGKATNRTLRRISEGSLLVLKGTL